MKQKNVLTLFALVLMVVGGLSVATASPVVVEYPDAPAPPEQPYEPEPDPVLQNKIPTLSSPEDLSVKKGNQLTITWVAADENNNPDHYTVTDNGILVESQYWDTGQIIFTRTYKTLGYHDIVITAFDDSGASAVDQVVVGVYEPDAAVLPPAPPAGEPWKKVSTGNAGVSQLNMFGGYQSSVGIGIFLLAFGGILLLMTVRRK